MYDDGRIYKIYNPYNHELKYSVRVGDYIVSKNENNVDEYYLFIGGVDDDDDIPLEKSVAYLRYSDNKFYKKKAISLDLLNKLLSDDSKFKKVMTPEDVSNSELIKCTINDGDNSLSVIIKRYFQEIGITKSEFKNLFLDKPSEVSNTFRKIEDGSLSWNRFVDLCSRLKISFNLNLETDNYESFSKENNIYYISKKEVKPYVYEVYTDGGYSPETGLSSYAYIINKVVDENKVRLFSNSALIDNKNVRSDEVELIAIIKSLEKFNDIQITSDDRIIIYTDYLNVVNAFNKNYINEWIKRDWKKISNNSPVQNKDLYIEILNILDKLPIKVEWEWVESHKNNPINTEVDKMCKSILKR